MRGNSRSTLKNSRERQGHGSSTHPIRFRSPHSCVEALDKNRPSRTDSFEEAQSHKYLEFDKFLEDWKFGRSQYRGYSCSLLLKFMLRVLYLEPTVIHLTVIKEAKRLKSLLIERFLTA